MCVKLSFFSFEAERNELRFGFFLEGIEASVQIFNSQGGPVRLIDAGSKDTSLQKIGWDGKNQAGSTLPDGVYTLKVLAVDTQGQSVPVTTYQTGTVDGVSLDNGSVALQVNGGKIQFGDILSILN